MDTLKAYNEFSKAVAAALNAAGVKQIDDENVFGALMIVVGEPTSPPIGGAINFDEEAQKWIADEQVNEGSKLEPVFFGEAGIA